MSLFSGPPTDADRRHVQRRSLTALTELVELGAKKKLPTLTWRLPNGHATLSGTVNGVFTQEHHPREVFEAWFTALTDAKGIEPGRLGIVREETHRYERTYSNGQTRMISSWTLQVDGRKCEFVVIAEWYEDEQETSAEAVAQ